MSRRYCNALTVGDLRVFLSSIPDEVRIAYKDPNFTGPHSENPVELQYGADSERPDWVLVEFPFETPCE